MQFLSAANFRRKNHDKHIEDNNSDEQFQKAFQIGLSLGLSRSKRCFSSFQRSTFFGADIQTLVKITKQFRNFAGDFRTESSNKRETSIQLS